jgi:hypothetical protein
MNEHREISELNEHELYLNQHDLLQKFSFKAKMKLKVTKFDHRGVQMIVIEGQNIFVEENNKNNHSVCDNPQKMFINFSLKDIGNIRYEPSQDIEVKYTIRRIMISLLPVINIETQKMILANGLDSIDFSSSRQQWKKKKAFDGVSISAYFQALIRNQYVSKNMSFNMANTFGNLRNRIKELKRGKYDVSVMIFTSDQWDNVNLKKFLSDRDIYSQANDGVIVVARDTVDNLFKVVGMVTHQKKTAFKILREIFDQAIYIEINDISNNQRNDYLVSASYLLPYTNEYNSDDNVDTIVEKVVNLAKKMEKSWGN